MAEQIIDGTGQSYALKINSDGSLNVSGISISSTAGSQSWIQNTVSVTPSGIFDVGISGNIIIGSVTANVDSIYVQSGANIDLGSAWTTVGSVYDINNGSEIWVKNLPIGSNYILETNPTSSNRFNYKTSIVYSGTAVGSIYHITSAGSWLQVLTYDGNDNVIEISEWSNI